MVPASPQRLFWQAGWVWCGPGELRKGAVVVSEAGRVREVLARRPAGEKVQDLGNGLLLPGLVNAHTHLELSFLAGRLKPGGDFVGWLEELVALRPGHDHEQALDACRLAARRMAAAGIACVADITNTGRAQAALAEADLSALSYFEALGAVRCEPPAEKISWQGPRLTATGIAAHSPYSVPGPRLVALKRRARRLPFCLHVAESAAEMEFFAGKGQQGRRLEEFLSLRGARRAELCLRASRPLAHLLTLGVVDENTLLVHGVQLDSSEASALAATGASLCLCPRSNLALTGALAPVKALAKSGVNLALGTDSLASAPDVSLWPEMTALAMAMPSLPPEEILAMATTCGAKALGLAGHFGRIAPGMMGPLAFAPLPELSRPEILPAVVHGALVGPPRRVDYPREAQAR